jgi:hypothetical protein
MGKPDAKRCLLPAAACTKISDILSPSVRSPKVDGMTTFKHHAVKSYFADDRHRGSCTRSVLKDEVLD